MNNFDRVREMVDEYVKKNGTSTVMERNQFLDWVHQKYENISSRTNNLYPTDISYNLFNAGLKDFPGPNLCLWWEESSDNFRLVGSNYKGTGPVIQYKGKSNERIVAKWENGVLSWLPEYESYKSPIREKRKTSVAKETRFDTDRFVLKEELDKTKGILLLQDISTGQLLVSKEYQTYNKDVFGRLKNLNLKGLPKIYEVSEKEGKLYTLEEYIHGLNYNQLIEKEGFLQESEIQELAVKLCAIVSGLHKQNPPLIHRDIKPSNIMMRSGGEIILIDFNASKEYHAGNNQDTMLYGTQYFAAPEQLVGYGQSEVSTDVFGIGATMSYLMTGMPALQFVAPGKLTEVWKKCTEIDKKNRYQSVDELATDIIKIWNS